MRSFVAWPMRHGRLFLAGDAAHIVPPTGAKGLNLAVWDVRVLGEAILAFSEGGRSALRFLSQGLARPGFLLLETTMPHTEPEDPGGYNSRLQLARLAYMCSSESAARSLAENYAISRSASPTARFPRWGSTLTKGIKTSRLASATSRTSSF
ncbi:MAG TPA: FAD-dependent monooxygenase [Solirubrobacterales bacterium]|nr:FAD-dependent monooxygenase [Solirubrobacterales bacterium]